jgi:hypothetical protein
MRTRLSFVLIALGILMIAGCSKPPEIEMRAAQSALDAARASEADTYVPAALAAATDTLNAAQALKTEQDSKFALFRSYGKSKDMYIRAKALAETAATQAVAEKERVRQEVMALMTEAQAALDSATTALASAPKGKGNKAEIELITNDLNNIKAQFAAAQDDFTGGRFKVAKSKVETLMAKTTSLMDELAAAAAKSKGLR